MGNCRLAWLRGRVGPADIVRERRLCGLGSAQGGGALAPDEGCQACGTAHGARPSGGNNSMPSWFPVHWSHADRFTRLRRRRLVHHPARGPRDQGRRRRQACHLVCAAIFRWTLTLEFLTVSPPPDAWAAGVTLFFYLNSPDRDGLWVGKMKPKDGGLAFHTGQRIWQDKERVNKFTKAEPAVHESGFARLRAVRKNAAFTFWAGEGDEGPFVELSLPRKPARLTWPPFLLPTRFGPPRPPSMYGWISVFMPRNCWLYTQGINECGGLCPDQCLF